MIGKPTGTDEQYLTGIRAYDSNKHINQEPREVHLYGTVLLLIAYQHQIFKVLDG